MTTKHICSLAALAIMMAACTSDDNSQQLTADDVSAQPIPFIATIQGEQATRGLTEAEDGKTIAAKWEEGEPFTLVIGGTLAAAKVISVDDKGNATITSSILGAKDGADVYVVYAGTKFGIDDFNMNMDNVYDKTKGYFDQKDVEKAIAMALAKQDGTFAYINETLDYRYAKSTLKMEDEYATFGSTVKPTSQLAIWKVALKDKNGKDLNVTPLVVKDAKGTTLTTLAPKAASNTFYFALSPAAKASYTFEVAVGNDTYSCSKTDVTLEAGKYYRSTLTMKSPEPEKMTVSATGYNGTYDSQAHSITVNVTVPATGAEIAYCATKDGTYSKALPTYTDAGTYTTYYKVTCDGYTTVTGSAEVKIAQAAGTISFATNKVTITYGETVPANALSHTGDGKVSYSSTNTGVATVDKDGKVTVVGAGTTTIKATVANAKNYAYATTEASYTLEVNSHGGLEDYSKEKPTEW